MRQLGQKATRICQACGDEFETINLGMATAIYCLKCAEGKIQVAEEDERIKAIRQKEDRQRQLVRFAQIPPKWQGVSFEGSNPSLNPNAFNVARKYAERFSMKSSSLILYSPGNGTGKTHMAVCIANYVLHSLGYSVLFKKARDLMLEIRRTFSDREETEAGILDKVLSAQLLVLDDVGVDPASQWIYGTYWTVFDRRLEWQLPVIVTTNKPIEASSGETLSDKIGAGAVSRLIELCRGNVIDMTGDDLR